MTWHHRLANVFRSTRLRRDIDRELEFHIEERIDELRASGLSLVEARRQARRQFGNPAVKLDDTLDVDVWRWLETTIRNIRISIRSLARAPGMNATVVLTLTLGIGATSAV